MIQANGLRFLELTSLAVDGEADAPLFQTIINIEKIDCITGMDKGCLIYVNGSDEPIGVRDSMADIRQQLTNSLK